MVKKSSEKVACPPKRRTTRKEMVKPIQAVGAQVWMPNDASCVADILQNLDKTNLVKFRESAFGHFLKLSNFNPQNQLIYVMLQHVENSLFRNGRITFSFLGKNLEFGPIEFLNITGLRFAPDRMIIPADSNLHKEVFGDKGLLTYRDIHERLKEECSASGGKSERALKLSMLLLLYGLLLVSDTSCVQHGYIHLADDLPNFNNFPWGSVAYKFLLNSIENCKQKLDKQLASGQPVRFEASGFTYSLLAFMFEVHAGVANFFGSQNAEFRDVFPRMLRWSTGRRYKYKEVVKYFNSANRPDELELGMDMCRGTPEQTDACTNELKSQPKGKHKAKSARNNSTDEAAKNVDSAARYSKIPEFVKLLMEKLSSIEKEVKETKTLIMRLVPPTQNHENGGTRDAGQPPQHVFEEVLDDQDKDSQYECGVEGVEVNPNRMP